MKASFAKVHNLRKQLVDSPLFFYLKSGTLALFMRVVGMGFGYLLTFFIARYYGAEALGLFSIILTIILISSVLSRLGIDTALLRFISEFHAKKEESKIKDLYFKGLFVSLFGSICISLAMYFLAPWIGQELLRKEELVKYLKILSFFIPLFTLSYLHSEILRAKGKIFLFVFLQHPTGTNIVSLPILAILFFFGMKSQTIPIYVFFFSIIMLFFIGISSWIFISKIQNTKKKRSLSYLSLLKISIPMFLVSSLMLIMNWTDTLMLSAYVSTTEVGIYNAALRLAGLGGLILFAINSIVATKFAALYSENKKKEFQKLAQISTHICIFLSLPLFFLIFFFSKNLMLLFGNEFMSGENVLVILALGQLINNFTGTTGYIMNMTGKEKIYQIIMLIALLINISANFLLIPKLGIFGAALASVLSMTGLNIVVSIYIRHVFGFWTFGGISSSLQELERYLKTKK